MPVGEPTFWIDDSGNKIPIDHGQSILEFDRLNRSFAEKRTRGNIERAKNILHQLIPKERLDVLRQRVENPKEWEHDMVAEAQELLKEVDLLREIIENLVDEMAIISQSASQDRALRIIAENLLKHQSASE